jgi:hypothetical protein
MRIGESGWSVRRRRRAKLEQRVRRAAMDGRLVDLRTGRPEQDDPVQGATWDAARTVGAELLIELLTTKPGERRVGAVKLRGARLILQP